MVWRASLEEWGASLGEALVFLVVVEEREEEVVLGESGGEDGGEGGGCILFLVLLALGGPGSIAARSWLKAEALSSFSSFLTLPMYTLWERWYLVKSSGATV